MHFKSNLFLIAEKFKITVYSSERSRLRVFIADTPGPLVDGRITFLTESNTNEGLAHSLEHLCFMGTQKYLQKGMLDRIANSCMANGTNAYTDQHHTCYELTTVGSIGFLKVIPVLLEHLLQPLLTCHVGYGDSLASPGQSCAILMGSLSTAFLLQKIRFNKDWAERDTMLTLLLVFENKCITSP
ncbi:hypothetical protein niasHT_004126 [Heterodera trifolii]|uniref:Peptidase M16 N-terminal domain-containing protein n=1 Tax=Heterodera trifolii TaxID=157864 RepID=A0ABD2M6G8_9BILA